MLHGLLQAKTSTKHKQKAAQMLLDLTQVLNKVDLLQMIQ
jgi:hypothetical protein